MNGQKKYDNVFNLIFKEVIEIQSRLIPYNNVSYKLLPSFNTEEHLRNKKWLLLSTMNIMLGIHKLDQMKSYYEFPHKSVKWW